MRSSARWSGRGAQRHCQPYSYGAAGPGNVALAQKCESLPPGVHSKECMALGRNDPELFSPEYRAREGLADGPAAPGGAEPPHAAHCSDADRAHGRNGC